MLCAVTINIIVYLITVRTETAAVAEGTFTCSSGHKQEIVKGAGFWGRKIRSGFSQTGDDYRKVVKSIFSALMQENSINSESITITRK